LQSPVIDSKKTSKEITDKILLIVKNSIDKSETIFKLCNNINQSVVSEFYSRWDCNAFYNNIGFYYTLMDQNYAVNIRFGKLSINIWKLWGNVSNF
jgi:CRISPR/Cas system CSM-associated protein Csm4 (group 5 of RAMP superfamily)